MGSRRRLTTRRVIALIGLIATGLTASAASASTAHATPPLPAPVHCPDCWHPKLHSRWQYQLQAVRGHASTGGINVTLSGPRKRGGADVSPKVWDIDLFVDHVVSGNDTTLNTGAVDAIHARGGHVICYVDAGTWENWRADAGRFPASVLGRHNGWPGERWLDIRQLSTLRPIMSARVRKCQKAGFDGVEFDNVDGYTNPTGFPLTGHDQLRYDMYLANLAHRHGLSVALKNDVGQLKRLKPYFDYSINEQCMQYHECAGLARWTASGKAVYEVEYRTTAFNCKRSNAWNFNAIYKHTSLYARPWTPCR